METKITESQVYARLATVIDPELHIDIVKLGLIYKVSVNGKRIDVEMTLTTPGCPLAPVIDRMIKEALEPLGADINLELVWDPPWTIEHMADDARLELGLL